MIKRVIRRYLENFYKRIIEKNDSLTAAIKNNFTYICDETLAVQLDFEEHSIMNGSEIELIDNISTKVLIIKN